MTQLLVQDVTGRQFPVDAVARTNVGLVLAEIRRRSPVLADLEKKGSIKITGAMYSVSTGVVDFPGW